MKKFEVGLATATLEKTSSGYWTVTVTMNGDDEGCTNMFATEVEALREILSYAEIKD